jgi:hypothetical protein
MRLQWASKIVIRYLRGRAIAVGAVVGPDRFHPITSVARQCSAQVEARLLCPHVDFSTERLRIAILAAKSRRKSDIASDLYERETRDLQAAQAPAYLGGD